MVLYLKAKDGKEEYLLTIGKLLAILKLPNGNTLLFKFKKTKERTT